MSDILDNKPVKEELNSNSQTTESDGNNATDSPVITPEIRELREEAKNYRLKAKELQEKLELIENEKKLHESETLKKKGEYEKLYNEQLKELESLKSVKAELEQFKQKAMNEFVADLGKIKDEETRKSFEVLGVNGHEALKKYLSLSENRQLGLSVGSNTENDIKNGVKPILEMTDEERSVFIASHGFDTYQAKFKKELQEQKIKR